MIELIKSIPGPTFLYLYFGYAGVVILLSRLFSRYDKTGNLPVPEPTQLKPWEISYLKKGLRGAILTTTMELLKQKKLKSQKSQRKMYLKTVGKQPWITPIERELLSFFSFERPYADFFRKSNLDSLARKMQKDILRLKDMKLIPPPEAKKQQWLALLAGMLLIIGLAATKMYLGVQNDKPIGFLTVLLVLAIIAQVIVIRPGFTNTTTLGRKLLALAQKRFQWSRKSQTVTNGENDLIYMVALYGMMPVAGTDYELLIEDPKSFNSASSSSNGGCGGGCSGGCSGGGGGGCGGGGCGGGCGGCGG